LIRQKKNEMVAHAQVRVALAGGRVGCFLLNLALQRTLLLLLLLL